MPAQAPFEFHLISQLGISVVLFLLYGADCILISGLAPFLLNSEIDQQIHVISNRRAHFSLS